MKNLYLLAVITVITGLSSCKLDPNWDVEALAPIAQTTLTPANLLGDSNIVVQPGGDLVFDYERTVFNFPADSILQIPDSLYSYSFNAPISFTVQPGFPIPVFDDYLLFNVPYIGLSSAYVGSGKLKIQIQNKVTQPAIINFQIPKAKKDGVVFSFTDNLAAAPVGGYSVYEKEVDIDGYGIDFSGDNSDQYNKLRMKITATIAATAQPVPVSSGQELIKTSISFEGIKPAYARGRIYKRSVEISQNNIDLPFMDMVKSGMVDVDAIDMSLTVKNGYGIEARCLFNNVSGLNTRTGNTVALNHPIIGNSINLNAAAMASNGEFTYFPSSYLLSITTSNSNLEPFAVNFPNKISVNGSFTVNPNGDISSGNDFVFSTASAKINLHVVAPLVFSVNNLILGDTVKFNGASLKKNNPIKSGKLKIYAENKFPIECGIKLSATDSMGNVLWSNVAEQLIAAGIAESDGRVYQSVSSILGIELSPDDFEKLSHCNGISFEVRFHTLPTSQLIKIYEDYKLGLKVVAEVKAGI